MMSLISRVLEHIPKEIKTFINNENTKTNILRIQAYYSVICGYFCLGFIDFMFKGKTLTEFTNLFSPNSFEKNDDIILSFFKDNNSIKAIGKTHLSE